MHSPDCRFYPKYLNQSLSIQQKLQIFSFEKTKRKPVLFAAITTATKINNLRFIYDPIRCQNEVGWQWNLWFKVTFERYFKDNWRCIFNLRKTFLGYFHNRTWLNEYIASFPKRLLLESSKRFLNDPFPFKQTKYVSPHLPSFRSVIWRLFWEIFRSLSFKKNFNCRLIFQKCYQIFLYDKRTLNHTDTKMFMGTFVRLEQERSLLIILL